MVCFRDEAEDQGADGLTGEDEEPTAAIAMPVAAAAIPAMTNTARLFETPAGRAPVDPCGSAAPGSNSMR